MELLAEDCDHESVAQVNVVQGQRVARLRLSPRFREEGDSDAGETILHELLHAALGLVEHSAANVRDLLGEPVYAAWRGGFDMALERAVDDLARGLAPALPRFRWPPADTNEEP